ncbi:hypothetical protein EMIHUDRAFT_209487 [Emiliania huxleyi CCMP1516]|uniref:Nudix hydrolase domain-containing protein n=2 Tax=Emiliania huxleyi TaxID=2903 RepID=A0A0D3J5S8_EMIH1|nr:hypothetical protein EMIHUDRAFT_209487 [Emiliania huxleyi CCMP1516]EOD18863.1 hypothetical protein EMIHUDRAFT_209487 [Emiliania huxleyi CCMP1516]|eukprot:XP_005771292.1 hypothetical protein EMIHUDRAFT_209487 [Emiliania huxleyi CCMP1516]
MIHILLSSSVLSFGLVPAITRSSRLRRLRPVCDVYASVSDREVAELLCDASADDCDVAELEQRPMRLPPPRTPTRAGYVADPSLVSWAPFTYAEPYVRRSAARDYARTTLSKLPPLPPLRVVLMGGVAAGKGTIAPMLSQAFRVRCIGVGELLRGETRARRARGVEASHVMAAGVLLPDELAEALVGGSWAELRPDAVVLVERPDELAREFALGRCCDSATGQTYHPVYAPAPAEICERLVWRVDDTSDALNRRLSDHKRSVEAIVGVFESAGIPLRRFDNARSELETFGEVAEFLRSVAMGKLEAARSDLAGGRGRKMSLDEVGAAMQPSPADPADVAPYCFLDEDEEECLSRFQRERRRSAPDDVDAFCGAGESEGECVIRYKEEAGRGELLAAVQRCNSYALREFTPLLVGDEQVGWLNPTVLEERSEFAAALELVEDGVIPRSKLRHELQDVHPFSAGFVAAGGGVAPVLRMERASMIYFGVPSYGVHVNGWATYPGLLDQMVAGGQPTALTFDENVRKECEEEASLPPEVIAAIEPAGSVSYRYATPKGLSTKVLMTHDVEMPQGLQRVAHLALTSRFQPLCSDGEVEQFRLLPIAEVLRSLREDLPVWKPNSALVAIDFLVRHRLVSESEPGVACTPDAVTKYDNI